MLTSVWLLRLASRYLSPTLKVGQRRCSVPPVMWSHYEWKWVKFIFFCLSLVFTSKEWTDQDIKYPLALLTRLVIPVIQKLLISYGALLSPANNYFIKEHWKKNWLFLLCQSLLTSISKVIFPSSILIWLGRVMVYLGYVTFKLKVSRVHEQNPKHGKQSPEVFLVYFSVWPLTKTGTSLMKSRVLQRRQMASKYAGSR